MLGPANLEGFFCLCQGKGARLLKQTHLWSTLPAVWALVTRKAVSEEAPHLHMPGKEKEVCLGISLQPEPLDVPAKH